MENSSLSYVALGALLLPPFLARTYIWSAVHRRAKVQQPAKPEPKDIRVPEKIAQRESFA
jgi:hypothetical protein